MDASIAGGNLPGLTPELQAWLQQSLQQSLQKSLRDWVPESGVLPPAIAKMQVQSGVRQGKLMVLAQHGPIDPTEPVLAVPLRRSLFAHLEHQLCLGFSDPSGRSSKSDRPDGLVQTQNFADSLPPNLPVVIYLRVLGQKQPYDTHSFQLAPIHTAQTDFPGVNQTEHGTETKLDEAELGEELGRTKLDGTKLDETRSGAKLSKAESSAIDHALTPPSSATPAPLEEPWDSDVSSQGSVQGFVPPSGSFLRSFPWPVATAAGVSVVAFLAGMFVVSRPCVVGQCASLSEAQALSQQALQNLKVAKSPPELQQAQQQLTEANHLLKSVPPWSRHRAEAEALLQAQQSQTIDLDRVMAAASLAETASQKAQTGPLPIGDWQTLQGQWRSAIGQLQEISPSSSLSATVQPRLASYRANLAQVEQRLRQEQQAQKSLTTAKNSARLAETRQGIAQSVETWQLARSTWQVTVNALKAIPSGTTSYAEAQSLLQDYNGKLSATVDRAKQEQLASKSYTQALTLAQQAKNWEQKNQWATAVSTWRTAVMYARQVPEGTFFRKQSEPLVNDYTNALKLAEAKSQAATAILATRRDLDRVCIGSPRICTYTITRDLIRIQFTSGYERAVRTAFLVGQSGDRTALGGTFTHLESLQSALQTISTNTGIPLEAYNSDNEMIGFFNPGG